MSFSINTNIASLEAQNYLQQSVQFQNQTINEVTSGLRIVNSGDDAAGLAVANGLAADQAVLTQGIQNANDGLATLQTIDGGMNNISQLLNRADTLATESASSTFTGNRQVLNSEFQSVLTEINRQAQSIGLNSGGQFAQNLQVFIGGGQKSGDVSAIQNGSINIDLSNATVDTQSLGLSGYSVQGNSSVDIGTGGGTTSVSNIIANTTNQASETQAGNTTFYFTGAGFANTNGADRIAVSVNLNGVTDANSLVTAINSAIQAAGNGSTQQATAFKNAGIVASVYTNAAGQSSLQFTSSTSAFQVEAGDQTANALLGNISSGSTGQSVAATTALATGQANVSAATGNATINLAVSVAGQTTATPVQVSLTAADSTAQDVLNAVNSALTTANAGVTASLTGGTTGKLQFTATNGNQAAGIQVLASGDTNNYLGLGSFLSNGTSNAQYTSITATGADFNSDTQDVQIAIGNQLADLGNLAVTGNLSTDLTTLNNALQGNTLTKAAGITAVDNNGAIELTSSNSTAFRLNVHGQANQGFGFGVTAPAAGANITAGSAVTAAATQNLTVQIGSTVVNLGTISAGANEAAAIANINSAIAVAAASNSTLATAALTAADNGGKIEISAGSGTFSLYAGTPSAGNGLGFAATAGTTTGVDSSKLAAFTGTPETGSITPSLDSQGTSTSGFLNFQGFTINGNSQTVSLTAPDSSGNEHAISFSLSSSDASNIDQALQTINNQLQDSNDSTLQQIVAVKDQQNGVDGISFISSLPSFNISLGTTSTGTGAGAVQGISGPSDSPIQGGPVISSTQNGTGSTADISTLQNAENAVAALTNAVTSFGNAQAAVGEGENLFTYATNLAQSQVTSEAASESGIKDANLAEEASNLSKAQILVQAGTAALAQANSAPQAILSLLQH